MRTTLTQSALLMAAIPLSAFAQAAPATTPASIGTSSVTLYGIVDVYVQYGKGGAGFQNAVQSGGVSGSRLGFKGSEDLGGGLKAVFQLESGIQADTGAFGQGGLAFGRQAYVGLVSSQWGGLTLGRQNIPQYPLLDSFDPFGTGAGSSASSGILSYTARANNAVVYQTPNWSGFSASTMVAMGESTAGKKTNGDVYGLSARYERGPFSAGLAMSDLRRGTDTAFDARYLMLASAYDFGGIKLTGAVQKVNNLGGVDAKDRLEGLVGVNWSVTEADVLSVGVGASRTSHLDGGSASQWTLGFAHALSKRTKLYAVLTRINNGSQTSYTADTATGAGPTTSAGKDVGALQLGMRHAF